MSNWGEARTSERGKQVVAVWRDTVIGGAIAGVALGVAARADVPEVRWALLAVGLLAAAWALWVGCVRYFRVIDEQEKFAAYWSGMIGLYAYAFLFGASLVAERFGLVVRHADHWVFWGVCAVTLAAFVWKRYR